MPRDIWGWYIFKILEISQMTGNFQDTQAFVEFPKYPGIWEISKIFKIYLPQVTLRAKRAMSVYSGTLEPLIWS